MSPDSQRALEHQAQVEEFRRRYRTELATLGFPDILGSTALKQQWGDKAGAALIQQHHALVREARQEFAEKTKCLSLYPSAGSIPRP